jgi:hypothetical protein
MQIKKAWIEIFCIVFPSPCRRDWKELFLHKPRQQEIGEIIS